MCHSTVLLLTLNVPKNALFTWLLAQKQHWKQKNLIYINLEHARKTSQQDQSCEYDSLMKTKCRMQNNRRFPTENENNKINLHV